MAERRQTERIFIRVPIRVRGTDQLGKPFEEKGATVLINRDGGRIGLANVPRFGSKLEITNLSNRSTAFFEVTSQCPQSYSGAPEWGVEFVDPETDFWGIAFQGRKEGEGPAVAALLACQGCGGQEMANLTSAEYEALGSNFVLSRSCSPCRRVTVWEVAATEEEEAAAPGPSPATAVAPVEARPAATVPERRRAKRLTLKVPVMVTAAGGKSELTETENLSESGLCFTCRLDLVPEEKIQLVVGYGLDPSASGRTCRIVWRKPTEKSVRYLYGVQLLEGK